MATAHPGNDYYVNSVTHTIQRQSNPLLAAALTTTGWSGPWSWTEAKSIASGITVPGIPGMPGSGSSGGGLTQGTGANLGGIAAIGDFFNRLTQSNTWIRVGEVVAGLLLVYIGFNAITRDTAVGRSIQSAKSGATKVAAVIPK